MYQESMVTQDLEQHIRMTRKRQDVRMKPASASAPQQQYVSTAIGTNDQPSSRTWYPWCCVFCIALPKLLTQPYLNIIIIILEVNGVWGQEATHTFSQLASHLAFRNNRLKSKMLENLYGHQVVFLGQKPPRLIFFLCRTG